MLIGFDHMNEVHERSTYAVGGIYLTVQNLPHNVWHKPENIILVGIMPGPHESSLTVNSYLTPLVLELQEAWTTGFKVSSPHGIPVTIKLALSCVACDIPASRKVSGFLGHSAALGCSKCLKNFGNHIDDTRNYSGYDEETWVKRDVTTHRKQVDEIAKETTKTGTSAAESEYGV